MIENGRTASFALRRFRVPSTLPAQELPRLTQRIPIDLQRLAAATCCR